MLDPGKGKGMDVDMRLVWFVLAGFLLGFSVSTLWEWLYFRRRRMAFLQLSEEASPRADWHSTGFVASENRRARNETAVHVADEDTGDNDAPETWKRAYQGPGVYLESEDDIEAAATEADRTEVDDAERDNAVTGDIGVEDRQTDKTEVKVQVSTSPAQSGEAGRQDRKAAAPSRPAVARTSRPAMPDIYRLESAEDPSQADLYRTQDAEDDEVDSSSATGSGFDASSRAQESDVKPPPKTKPAPAVLGRASAAATAPAQASTAEPSLPRAGSRTAGLASSAQPSRNPADYPDDLAKIKGIGEVYKWRLYAAGIYTWHQIAHTDEETLRAATQAYPSSNVDEWAEQAQNLALKYGRNEALYTGPLPNDLTRIYGIGPVGATTLYRAGICTYAQLAATTPEELAPLFPIAVAGDEPDFEHWIEQARKLSENE